jgi:hypothetical protein
MGDEEAAAELGIVRRLHPKTTIRGKGVLGNACDDTPQVGAEA